MYTLEKAIAKTTATASWIEVDLSSALVSDIPTLYYRALALVKTPEMSVGEVLDLMALNTLYMGYEDTLETLFTDIADTTLPTTAGALTLTNHYVGYADAFHAGYSVEPVSRTASPDSPTDPKDRSWLKLTKAGLDATLFNQNALVFVNGFLHFSESDTSAIYVEDADLSRQHSREATCGIVSFKEIGQLTKIKITSDMIGSMSGAPLYHKAVLKLTEPIGSRVALLSIGGYLMMPRQGSVTTFSPDALLVDFTNYSLLNRYYEASKYLDFSSFNLPTYDTNESQVKLSSIYSDTYIQNLLTMSQSFVILVDTESLVCDYEAIRTNLMPGSYTSSIRPTYPLRIGLGRLANYWTTFQKPYWSVNVIDGLLNHPAYQTNDISTLVSVDDKRESMDPVTYSRAQFLKLYSQTLS